MLVAVAGATGTAGTAVSDALLAAGHEVRALSRSSPTWPVDLTTGEGLEEALAGCEVLVDATNAGPKERDARAVLIDGGRRLLGAARDAGVKHHLCLSIVGIERVPLAYYRVKVEQEQLLARSGIPYTIVRATQFHALLDELFSAGARFRMIAAPRARLQPCDPLEVGRIVAGLAEREPEGRTVTVAGPEIADLRELAATWKDARELRALRVHVPLPRKLGRALRSGALTDESPDHRTERPFAVWLGA